MGDFNINTLDEAHTKSTLVQDFINIMSSYSYCKLISMPTKVIKNSATLKDTVYCNLPNIYDTGHSGVLYSIRTTDHMPIFTVQPLLSPSIIEGESFKMKRNFSNQNISNLKKTVRKHNWNEVYSAESAQLASTVFVKFIKLSFSECCPIEKIKINYRNRHDWISNDLKNEIRDREKLYKLSVQHPTDANVKCLQET